MSILSPPETREEVVYPDCDDQPIADDTLQFEWIVTLNHCLTYRFHNDPQVFVAADLLWYPVEGDPTIRMAPDGLVAIGRPKGHRGSYIQHREDGIPPQVVFEVRSRLKTPWDMAQKHRFYERYGVEEYYLYDAHRGKLVGWQRAGDVLLPIPQMEGWISPRLTLRFGLSGPKLQLAPPGGAPYPTYQELHQELRDLRNRRGHLQQDTIDASTLADQEEARAEQEIARAEHERARAEHESGRAANARARVERLAARLRALGIDPDDV